MKLENIIYEKLEMRITLKKNKKFPKQPKKTIRNLNNRDFIGKKSVKQN